jgi:PKD repeat protein
MNRLFAVVSAIVLALFFLVALTTTPSATAYQPPVDQLARSTAPMSVQHTQPITPGSPADVVLVLDQSESQSYSFDQLPEPWRSHCSQSKINDMYACLNGGTLEDGTEIPTGGCNGAAVSDPDYPELTRGICQPFHQSKEAAYRFIKQLRPDVDRIALIAFAENSGHYLSMTFDLSEALTALNNLDVFTPPNNVSQPNPDGHVLCSSYMLNTDKWKCGSSNIGGGLIQARDEFNSARPQVQWVTVMIADGPANRTSHDPRTPWSAPLYGICPTSEQTTVLKCRDADVNSRHFITATVDPLYDADDYAREYGDIIGLDPNLYPSLGSAGIQLFTVGLGKNMVCVTGYYTPPSNGQPATCTGSSAAYGDPDAGEQLLRYIADMGDDGNLSTGPCLDTQAPFRVFDTRADTSGRSDDVGLGLNCGNYYFAPDVDSLPTITLDIAARIITGSEPIPAFSAAPLMGFQPLLVTFTNQSSGDYTSLLWQFGDGATSADLNPAHTYATAGAFTVTLTLTNPTASATLTQTNYITVRTSSIPGAPADIALVLDQSESQSYDFASLPAPYNIKCSQAHLNDIYACLNGGMLEDGTTVTGCNNESVNDPNFPEITRGICQPFRQSKEAAYRFIQQLRPNTDRIALITFAETSERDLPMTFDVTQVITVLNTLDVYVNPANISQPNPDGHILCNSYMPTQDKWKCGSSNIGAALIQARDTFNSARPLAQWVTVFIADGPANRTAYDPRILWSDPQYGTCPLSERTTPIKCRDGDANSRHDITSTVDPLYDADDYAREYGDLLGLNADHYPSLNSAGIEIFTIGLGQTTVCLSGNYTPPNNGQPATCTNPYPGAGDPDAGEQLMKYIADIGYKGDLAIGPCLGPKSTLTDTWGIPLNPLDFAARSNQLGLSCGNYYFAPGATSLSTITLDIALRIMSNNNLRIYLPVLQKSS